MAHRKMDVELEDEDEFVDVEATSTQNTQDFEQLLNSKTTQARQSLLK